MLNKTRIILTYSFVALILFLNYDAYAANSQRLPRSFGALYLGMSVKEFRKIVDVPINRCVQCSEDELEADLYFNERQYSWELGRYLEPIKLNNAYIKYQPKELQPEYMVCYFYKNVLYSIEMKNVKATLISVKSRYVKALGKPTAIDVWDTGLSQLRWENSSTLLSVIYTTKTAGIDYLAISYTDLKITSQKK